MPRENKDFVGGILFEQMEIRGCRLCISREWNEMGESEEKLPREILSRVVKSGKEYGWRKDDAIQAIEAAMCVGLATLGGEIQFVLPEGTCELYGQGSESGKQKQGEVWADYVIRSGRECIAIVRKIVSEVDLIREGTEHFNILHEKAAQGMNLEDYLVFILYFVDQEEYQQLGQVHS